MSRKGRKVLERLAEEVPGRQVRPSTMDKVAGVATVGFTEHKAGYLGY